MTIRFHRFWVPQYKRQLVEWLSKYYKDEPNNKFKKMPKKQLYAIYLSVRTKENGGMNSNGR